MTRGADGGREVGLGLIVVYKLVKAVAELALGVVLLAASRDVSDDLAILAHALRIHGTAAWSSELAQRLVSAASARGLHVVALGALFDGALSLLEGGALQRRYAFAPWLVVVATSALVPFEIVALGRHFSLTRVALLFLNVLIVGYLIRRRVVTAADRQISRE